jgi:hypothetical protein
MLPESRLSWDPDRIVILVDSTGGLDTNLLAEQAVHEARVVMPKVTGYLVTTLRAIHGDNFFGIYFPDKRVRYLEQGTGPFTMNNLAGKTVPMWIDDPSGKERAANPKAKTRTTVDGRTQVLIFRRAALKGSRRNVRRTLPGGRTRVVSVPASYPGAAGRISRREASQPLTTAGRQGGRVARGNVGVRWRHPGITGRQFLNYAMSVTAITNGLGVDVVYLADAVTIFTLLRKYTQGGGSA